MKKELLDKYIQIGTIFVFVICLYFVAAKENVFDEKVFSETGLNIEKVHITIPNCKKTYHFIWISDLHIVIANDEIATENMELVRGRQEGMAITSEGKQSKAFWIEDLVPAIDKAHADALMFGGDMVDYTSKATTECLKKGLNLLETPYIYIRADHDTNPYWMIDQDSEHSLERQNAICQNDNIWHMEYDEFIILGINNTTNQVSKDALEEIKQVFAIGKPIIIVTHVPYDSVVDRSLDTISREAWGDRNLTWGQDTSYVPNAETQEFLDLVYEEKSQVIEVLGGHLHLSWDGYIKDEIHEHIFAPAYAKNIGVITVDDNP